MRVIPQRTAYDCGFASLAMLLGIAYNDVRDIVRERIDDPLLKRRGLILKQLEEIIGFFGFQTKRIYRKDGYLEGANGILGLLGGTMDKEGHWVVVKDGMIIDPDGGEAHTVEDYLKETGARPCTLLVLA